MMKKTIFLAMSLAACGDDPAPVLRPDAPPSGPDAPPGAMTIMVPAGDITTATRWAAPNTYVLEGPVFVTGGTLTVEPGVTVKGQPGSALTITAAAKLEAVGSPAAPIVFTSSQATPSAGDWGGLVMLGRAPINVTGGTNLIEGFAASAGDRIEYGGADAMHDCGTLSYARIEYAGFELSTDNELNGLTLGGCGAGTTIDYVQVHKGLDDGIEIFGGTVGLRHVVISQADDDGLDVDLGWTGSAQFVVVQQQPGVGDRAFEWDSNNSDNEAMPRSAPTVWNVTLIGGNGDAGEPQGGMHLRRGVAGSIGNGIVAYFTEVAVDIGGTSTAAQFGLGALRLQHIYFMKSTAADVWPAGFDGMPEDDCIPEMPCFDEATAIGMDETNHMNVDPMLAAPMSATAPSWMPAAASPVLTGCGMPPAGLDQTATYCGAFSTTDWTAGWTRFAE